MQKERGQERAFELLQQILDEASNAVADFAHARRQKHEAKRQTQQQRDGGMNIFAILLRLVHIFFQGFFEVGYTASIVSMSQILKTRKRSPMKIFSYVIFVFLGTAIAGFPVDAPSTSEQCAELERQLADIDQQIVAIRVNLEKLSSALNTVQDISKLFKDQYEMLKLYLDTQYQGQSQSAALHWRAGVLGEIAGNRAAFAANEQAIGGLFSAIASVKSQFSLRSKEYADKQKEYLAKCKPLVAP